MDYPALLYDKHIAFVGHGSKMNGSKNGSLIDSFDIVIRLNQALPIKNKEDYGSKTDVLYNCLDDEIENGGSIDASLWKNCGVKVVICPFPTSEFFVRPEKSDKLRGVIPVGYGNREVYDNLRKGCNGYRPNTGTASLVDVLRFEPKTVNLFGFDFFRTMYDKKYVAGLNRDYDGSDKKKFEQHLKTNPDRHDPDSQYMFFKREIYRKDKRVVVEPYFEAILNDDSYDKMFFDEE